MLSRLTLPGIAALCVVTTVLAQNSTPYPASSIALQADLTLKRLEQIRGGLAKDGLTDSLSRFVSRLSSDIAQRKKWTDEVLESDTRISALQGEVESWQDLREDAGFQSALLNARLEQLDRDEDALAEMTRAWQVTVESLRDVPSETAQRANSVLQYIAATGQEVDARQAELLGLQNALLEQVSQIEGMLARVESAQSDAVNRLTVRDSPPLWQAMEKAGHAPIETSIAVQWRMIADYFAAQRGLALLHLVLWAVLIVIFYRVRGFAKRTMSEDANFRATIFDLPVATATLIALIIASPFYESVCPLLTAVVDAALLIALLLIIRRIVSPALIPIMWALTLFFVALQVRELTAAFPFVTRAIFFVEMVGGVFFCLWLVRIAQPLEVPSRGVLWQTVRWSARVGFVLFLLAAAANLLGYVTLAHFTGNSALYAAYLALLFYAVVDILNSFAALALQSPLFNRLAMVRRHRPLLQRRLSLFFRWVVFLTWAALVLNQLLLLRPLLRDAAFVLTMPLIEGVTLGGIFTFLVTVWAAFLLSSFLRFLLEEDVYQRVPLKPGLPFAISTLLHYVILLLGFYLAAAALLGDITKFMVLAGAFGVGLGFGLQNVVNNFASSIIVLFERPIKIGDLVQIGSQQGTVRQIGIRATIIKGSDGADVIIPNGMLISDAVTNWTLTEHQRQLQIEVAVPAEGTDAPKIITLLEAAAAACAEVSQSPTPSAILASFGANVLHFELRAWTDQRQDIRRARSNLAVAVSRELAKNKIPTA